MGHHPVIEIAGTDFLNKGDELMLRTTLLEVRRRLGKARFAMSILRGTPAKRRKLGMSDVIWRPARSRAVSAAHHLLASASMALPAASKELMPDLTRRGAAAAALNWWKSAAAARSNHSLLPHQVNIVLDINGYAYGDAWDWSDVELLPAYYRAIRRRGGRVVLLPQTFGPFEEARGRRIFREIYASSDLCYARDRESYDRAAAILPDTERIRCAPDITTPRSDADGVPAWEVGDDLDWAKGKACIIPNCNMMTHLGSDVARSYVDFLARVMQASRRLGAAPFVLIHDRNGGDEEIAAAAIAQAGGDVPLVLEDDAFRAKAIIGRSYLTVSSRFHGLVNALSQGVPSLSVGWSHKYDMLLSDYGVPEALIDPRVGDDVLNSKLQPLFDPETRAETSARLLCAEAERVRKVALMWEEVIEVISPA